MGTTRRITIAAVTTAIVLGSIAAVAGPASAAQATTCTTYGVVGLDSDHSETTQIPKTSSSYNCTLQYGVSNSGVRSLQMALNQCYRSYWGTIAEDGVFGLDTYNFLRVVQTQIGVSSDGVYGPVTRSHMYWFASNLNCYPVSAYVGF